MANSSYQAPAGGSGGTGPSINPAQQSGSGSVAQTDLPVEGGSDSEVSSAPQSPAESLPRSDSESESEDSDDPGRTDNTRWNTIIPEASRNVPVGNIVAQRRGRRARQAVSTPAADPESVNSQQRAFRLWAMRQLLGEPVGIIDAGLNNALIASQWDLGTALRRMNDVLNQARRRHRTDALGRGLAEQQRDRLVGANSLHHNRRLGIDFLFTRLVQVVRADQVNMLTTLTLGQLLADNRFDVDEAVHAFLERLLHPEEVEHHQRLERRLRMINPNQMHLDQRIARLMEIAGTDDYYAARGLLMTHGSDMLRAMDHWMRHGLAAQPIPPSELTRMMFRSPRRPHTDTEDLWPHPRPIAGRLDNINGDDLADADMDYDDTTNPLSNGWFVRYPRSEARIGVNVPTRQRCDYIRRGDYTTAEVTTYTPKTGNNKGIVEPFDYNKSKHVQWLNSNASQWFRRVPGDTFKPKGIAYQDDENDWIWWWHNERFWELVEQHPELLDATTAADWPRRGIRWPMFIDKARLANDFNNRWAQATGSDDERSSRDVRSLDAQRRRIPALCNDFGLPYSPAHGIPKDPPQHSPPGSADEDGDNDDDAPKPPRKNVKPTLKKGAKKGTVKKDKGKGKKKVEHVDDMEEDEPESSDEGDESPSEQPVKITRKGTKKGGSAKRKRGQDDEESDHNDPTSGTSTRKKSGGPRRSRRNQGRK